MGRMGQIPQGSRLRTLVCQTRAHRETAADAFGDCHDIRRHAGPFMGEEFSGAADAGLHFVENAGRSRGVHSVLRGGTDEGFSKRG